MKKTLFFIMFLGVCSPIYAQSIFYQDFDPDSIVYYPIDHLYMDFNQDGDADAYLYAYATNGGWWFDCYSMSGWELLWCEDTITPINELDDDWRLGYNLLPPIQYERFAIRHLTDNGYCYGWMKVSYGVEWWEDKGKGQESGWHSKGYLILDSQCYCTIPDYPLRWGQTEISTGVGENSEGVFAVYPNPAKQSVTLIGQQIAEARLYSVTGQLVATKPGNGTESLTMDVSGLPSGLYFVTAIGEDGSRSVLKVVKE